MSLFPVLFAVYWSAVLVWCLLALRLCEDLSRRHPLVYASLGRPAPLAGSDLRGDVALLRFLLGGRYRFLEDRGLVRLCGAMRALFCVYVLFFLSLPGLIQR
ncbi:MAG TPA: hypothetical protein VIC28_08865 [Thermoanaerobaculia bacterium]